MNAALVKLARTLYGERWQAAIARDLGVAASTVADWARGANKPRAATRRSIIALTRRHMRRGGVDRAALTKALAAFEATPCPRDGRAPKLVGEALARAAALWADPCLTSEAVAAEVGLHRSNLTKLLGAKRPRDF